MEKITAKEGMYLTQKEIENEGARVFVVSLFLADNDSADNWRNATQQEYYDWQKKQDEAMERMLEEQSTPPEIPNEPVVTDAEAEEVTA